MGKQFYIIKERYTMKKMLSIIATTTAILTTSVACGRITSMTKVELIDPLPYVQHTPDNEIIEGNQTAHETINKLLNEEVSIGEDCPEGASVENCTVSTKEQEQYTCYTVEDYSKEKDIILFLFKDDTEGVVATEGNTSFIHDDDFIDMSWKDAENHKDNNYCGYAFAYHNGNSANAIVSSEVGTATSVWAYNPSSSEVRLIWCDYINCPIWKNYV